MNGGVSGSILDIAGLAVIEEVMCLTSICQYDGLIHVTSDEKYITGLAVICFDQYMPI